MFSTLKMRLLLGVYIFIILSIPVGAYLASQDQTFKSSASEGKSAPKLVKKSPGPSSASSPESAAKQLLGLSEPDAQSASANPSSSPEASSPTIANGFGPTLSLKVNLEGRPADNQSTKLFVGIVEGNLTSNPKFLLSFSVNLGKDGSYSNLSLAGLSSGTKYTALLKGTAQIATSSAFVMTPTVTNLNEGLPLNLLTGDMNEDNTINNTDYSIVQKALGTKNEVADFNKDGIVNTFDLGFVTKNLGQTGASGAWTSSLPKAATSSASLNNPSVGGYWIWIPQ